MLGAGLVLGSLAGLELSAREHFSGYRSHTLLLGGAVGVATVAGLAALTGLAPLVCLGAGVARLRRGLLPLRRRLPAQLGRVAVPDQALNSDPPAPRRRS